LYFGKGNFGGKNYFSKFKYLKKFLTLSPNSGFLDIKRADR
jgi:hypothetical protein